MSICFYVLFCFLESYIKVRLVLLFWSIFIFQIVFFNKSLFKNYYIYTFFLVHWLSIIYSALKLDIKIIYYFLL